MSTIVAHTFMTLQRRPTKATAGMLLCAILSDTLNLQGPTTTEWDRLMVRPRVRPFFVSSTVLTPTPLVHPPINPPPTSPFGPPQVTVLVEIAGVEDIQLLVQQQFRAKSSELAGLSR